MVECANLTLLAADAFAYERPRRDPPSSIRRPGSAIFVQYCRAPDLAPLRTSSLELEHSPIGHLLTGGPRVRIPFAPAGSPVRADRGAHPDQGLDGHPAHTRVAGENL